jgi:hypothetical protein
VVTLPPASTVAETGELVADRDEVIAQLVVPLPPASTVAESGELVADRDEVIAQLVVTLPPASTVAERSELIADRDEVLSQLLCDGGGLLRQHRLLVHAHDQSCNTRVTEY